MLIAHAHALHGSIDSVIRCEHLTPFNARKKLTYFRYSCSPDPIANRDSIFICTLEFYVSDLDQSAVGRQGCVAGADASGVSSEVKRRLFRPHRWQASSHGDFQWVQVLCTTAKPVGAGLPAMRPEKAPQDLAGYSRCICSSNASLSSQS